ncbi:hypothetical protein [Halalkalibacter okhensis]|uniref:Spore coat protein n=1 Tax=Halalkalibacter okhensis TaxID=333138 RepID=A0A0B0IH55_9BACI|nr:hypothetical protein [Halalkalibacter okhensis]KHF40650.1 spore coat protein [Halalkalibacter okhensis]
MYNYRSNMNQQEVITSARGDVTGDGVMDTVYLTGNKTPESPFVQNITLVVQDGSSGRMTTVPLPENTGYDPSLFLGEFTGDGIDDIFISIATGGSGGIMYHFLYSFVNNQAQLLFDSNVYNEIFKYVVTYQDFYKVNVFSETTNETYLIDLSLRDPNYLNEIYDHKGKLKSPINGFVNPLSGLYPVDMDLNGVYELLAYQKIAGRYNADSLGYVMNTLRWQVDRIVLQDQYVAIFGAGK